MLKVFVDSSVLLTAVVSATGAGREVILKGLEEKLDLSFSEYVFKEVERNLWRKRPDVIDLFRYFASLFGNIVTPSEDLIQQVAEAVEPKDAPIVAAAITAGADYIVSYDRKHLISKREEIHAAFHLIITTPDEVLSLLRAG